MTGDLTPFHTPSPGLDDDLRLQSVQRGPHILEQAQSGGHLVVRHGLPFHPAAPFGGGQQRPQQHGMPLEHMGGRVLTGREFGQAG